MTPEEKSMRARIAAHARWAKNPDRLATAVAGQRGLQAKFEREVDPDGVLDPRERALRAESARKAHFLRMAARSAKARARRKKAS